MKIINEFGPMSFRKENNIWYIYRFDNTFIYTGSRFKLFRVSLDSVYKYKIEKERIKNTFFYIDPLGKNNSEFFIDFTSKLRNIYSATGFNYDVKNNTYKDYELSEIVRIDDFGFDIKDKDTIDFVIGNAMVYNTTRKNIKNIKLKISLYDSFIDGKLISENTFLITDTLNKRELKILNINFKPQKKFKSDIVSAVNIKIINYD